MGEWSIEDEMDEITVGILGYRDFRGKEFKSRKPLASWDE